VGNESGAAENSNAARKSERAAEKIRVRKPGVTRTIEPAELERFLRLGWERA
jgi:hypothetical protein